MKHEMNIKALRQGYLSGKLKPLDVMEEILQRIGEDPHHAWIHVLPLADLKKYAPEQIGIPNPATEWGSLHALNELPSLYNPASGWLYNTNNWPWSAAGANSPQKADFPAYVESGTENARGVHAIRVLQNKKVMRNGRLGGRFGCADSYFAWGTSEVSRRGGCGASSWN